MVMAPQLAREDLDEPDISAIVTEDDTPVDNIYSEKQQRLLTEPLFGDWPGPTPHEDGAPRSFVALANVGVFSSTRLPPIVPDMLLSADVTLHPDIFEKKHRTYFVGIRTPTGCPRQAPSHSMLTADRTPRSTK